MRKTAKALLLAFVSLLVTVATLYALLPIPVTFAQQQTIYDPITGKAVGHASTDSQGTTTYYDAHGRATLRITKPPQKDKKDGK